MDKIIIGEGPEVCSAVTVFNIKNADNFDIDISQNSVEYWIHDAIFGYELRIFKNTKEGKRITNLIKDKVGMQLIQDYIDKIVLKKANVRVIREKLEEMKKEWIKEGKDLKSTEIRKVLGVSRF